MKKGLTLIIALFLIIKSEGQTQLFEKTYGGKYLDVPVFTYYAENKHYVFGNINTNPPLGTLSWPSIDISEQYGLSDYNMVVYDTAGVKLVDRSFGGLGLDILVKVIPNDSGFYLIGRSYSSNTGNKTTVLVCAPSEIWIVAVDFMGNKLSEKSLCIPAAYDALTPAAVFRAFYDVIELSDGSFMFYIGLWNTGSTTTYERLAWFITDENFFVKKRAWLNGIGASSAGTAPPAQRLKGINIVDLENGTFATLFNTPLQSSSTSPYYNFTAVNVFDTATTSVTYSKWFLSTYSVNASKKLIKEGSNLLVFMEDTPLSSSTTNLFSTVFSSLSSVAYVRTITPHTVLNKKDIWIVKMSNTLSVLAEGAMGSDEDTFINSVVKLDQPNTLLLGCSTKGDVAFDKTTPSLGGMDYWIVMFGPVTMTKIYDWSLGGSADDVLSVIGNAKGYLSYSGYSKSGVSGDKGEASRDSGLEGDYWSIINCLPPTPSFTVNYDSIGSGQLVTFTNTSLYTSEYTWDFGDGTWSYSENPVHYYYTPGLYDVKLYGYNPGGCSGSVVESDFIYVQASGVGVNNIVSENEILIYPNPASDKITISLKGVEIIITDNLGRLVLNKKIKETEDTIINISNFQQGVYYVMIVDEETKRVVNKKFIKINK